MTPEPSPAPSAFAFVRDARLLVVDDEPGIRDLLSMELTALGYAVETARDGVEALEALTLQNFQLVICDMQMPNVGGLDVLNAIQEKYSDTEIILMTGYGTVETAVEAMKKGAYDFIQKPFDLNELMALVEKCLEKVQLRGDTALYEASRAVFRSLSLDELLPLIGELATSIFHVDEVAVMLVDPAERLVPAFEKSASGRPAERMARLALAEAVWKEDKRSNRPRVISPSRTCHPDLLELARRAGVQASLLCPFSVNDEPLGMLGLHRLTKRESFLASDVHRAVMFTSQVALAVSNARLYRQLTQNIDELHRANMQIEETKQQLIQSEKLAGIGQMAAGVAHELNNPLSAVIGFTQLVMHSEGLTEQQQSDLKTVFAQSKRCQTIIQNLLQFCRRHTVEQQSLRLEPLIQSVLTLLHGKTSTAGVTVTVNVPPNVPPVVANGNQLEQVLINLLNNAMHALTGRPNPRITVTLEVADRVAIHVTDNGCGIPAEIQNKIFEPFFTTKPVGQGTGLGLSICYGIVKQHGGVMRVRSEVNKGSTFTVELPLPQARDATKERP